MYINMNLLQHDLFISILGSIFDKMQDELHSCGLFPFVPLSHERSHLTGKMKLDL